MKKIWLIFKYEYARRVKTRGFIFAVLSMPILVVLAMLMAVISVSLQTNKLPAGYVDLSGAINQPPSQQQSFNIVGDIELLPFTDVAAGEDALANEEIQALFVIQTDYLQSGSVIAYANERPGDNAFERMQDFLQSNLIAGEDAQIQTRIARGSNITVRSLDGSRQASMRDWFVVLYPFLTGLIFIIVINISGGYLLQSVVDEKENRTMEVIVTSVSPEQLMTGKILGNLSVGLTQLLIWLLFAAVGLAGMQMIYRVDFVPALTPDQIALFVGLILPGFILIAALMTLVGVSVTDMREAQQVSLLFTMPMVAPYWFAGALLQHPGHPLSVIMSLFPLTAVVSMPMRISIASVPTWQIISAYVLTWLSALAALKLAARGFRRGMLQYQHRIRFNEILKGRSHE
jgi:ABC-2 type transport system permease protein